MFFHNTRVHLLKQFNADPLSLSAIHCALLHQLDIIDGKLAQVHPGTFQIMFVQIAHSVTLISHHVAKPIVLLNVARLGSHPTPHRVKEIVESLLIRCANLVSTSRSEKRIVHVR